MSWYFRMQRSVEVGCDLRYNEHTPTSPRPPLPLSACQAPSLWRDSHGSSSESSEEIWGLENDNDIRKALEGLRSSIPASHRPTTARSVATRGARSDITTTLKPAACPHSSRRRPETAYSAARKNNTRLPCGTAKHENAWRKNDRVVMGVSYGLTRPDTRELAHRLPHSKPADMMQLRREMLLRSHGLGHAMECFADQPYETTAMGRRAPVRRLTADAHEVGERYSRVLLSL